MTKVKCTINKDFIYLRKKFLFCISCCIQFLHTFVMESSFSYFTLFRALRIYKNVHFLSIGFRILLKFRRLLKLLEIYFEKWRRTIYFFFFNVLISLQKFHSLFIGEKHIREIDFLLGGNHINGIFLRILLIDDLLVQYRHNFTNIEATIC